MQLSDVTWGDVVSDSSGVLVVRGEYEGRAVVIKRYAIAEHAREVGNYALLRRLGVPTLPVLGSGVDWLVLADLAEEGWRQGTAEDLYDPGTARLLARWYHDLHAAGSRVGPAEAATLYSESDVVDADGLARVAERWPELALGVAWAQDRLPEWRRRLAGFARVLTHNDFWHTNFAVAWDDSSALVFGYNLLGTGYRYSDLRNVTTALSAEAGAAFQAEYGRLAGADGVHLDPGEAEVDEPIAHLAGLVLAVEADGVPYWAEESMEWLRRQVRFS